MVKLKLLIDGVDRTSSWVEHSWVINDNDGDMIDACEVEVEDPDNTITLTENKDLVIEDDDDSTTRFFAGIITEIATETLNGIGRTYKVTAQDWKVILDRAHFSAITINANDSAIIATAFTEAGISEINTSDLVQTGRQISHLVFRGASLRVMMDTLTQITGFYWDVNKFKKLIYRPHGYVSSSFALSDAPNNTTTFPYYRFNRRKSIAQYNKIEIRGGVKLTNVTNQTYSGDGNRKLFALSRDGTTATGGSGTSGQDYPMIFRGVEGSDPDIPTIQRNTGSNASPTWTTQTVGILGQDTGKDVLWNPTAPPSVEWATAPPNFAANAWRISGRALVPASHIATDDSAIAVSGRVFTKVIILPEIEDSDQAMDVADAYLRDLGAKDYLRVAITKDGLVVGDTIQITNTPHGLSSIAYFVHSMSMRSLGGEIYEYSVVLRNAP